MPCLRKLASALSGSHSKATFILYIHCVRLIREMRQRRIALERFQSQMVQRLRRMWNAAVVPGFSRIASASG
jgi:hypothetical protein